MISPLQQKARNRKFVYAALILVLFTVSLVHRRWIVIPRAEALQLREVSRGEAELTSSAVRLSLTGSRGLAVTFLWSTALELQDRQQWNELELLVGSITSLQPYFVTPWMFQSWNLAFNVAVECDRTRDKYYYVSRGAALLAEGERRNHKQGFPGNPDMRFFEGFIYQLKIATSDEKETMRSLLDMSLIDPINRDPNKLWAVDKPGVEVDMREFENFCVANPRLVRRLREKLDYVSPAAIVQFLEDNRDIPSRFKPLENSSEGTQSPLKPVTEQFPLLPPERLDLQWPDPLSHDMTAEAPDVNLICRTWYEYAQAPLPPLHVDYFLRDSNPDEVKYRMPSKMASQIFRGYPAMAQSHIAESLDEEGWFDGDGWEVSFDKDRLLDRPPLRLGTDRKYWASESWNKTYDMYLDFGTKAGLYFSAQDREMLEKKAALIRQKMKVGQDEPISIRSDELQGELGESFNAHERLRKNRFYESITNFDFHFHQAEGERMKSTVYARKKLFEADRFNVNYRTDEAIQAYEMAWPFWIDAFLINPNFAKVDYVREGVYERQVDYFLLVPKQNASLFRSVLMGTSQMAAWPYPPWEELLTPAMKSKITSIRRIHGPLDELVYYDAPNVDELKQALIEWSNAGRANFQVPTPFEFDLLLSRSEAWDSGDSYPWRHLIPDGTRDLVLRRRGWTQ